jgi:hypothetical protein
MTSPEPDDAYDPRPWERPGVVRRDCEPHRGDRLKRLGFFALLGGLLLLLLAAPTFDPSVHAPLTAKVAAVGFLLVHLSACLVVGAAARRDLREMDAGRMEPWGHSRTREALWRCVGGGLFSGLLLVGLVVVLLTSGF